MSVNHTTVHIPSVVDFESRLVRHFNRPLEDAFGQRVSLLLSDAEKIARFYQYELTQLVAEFDVSSAPLNFQVELRQLAGELPFFGLYTHCLMFDYPNRLNFSAINREDLLREWMLRSIRAKAFLSSVDEQYHKWPTAIFDVLAARLEPIQKDIGLGWWRRSKNDGKYKNLFACGFLLGTIHDFRTQAAGP